MKGWAPSRVAWPAAFRAVAEGLPVGGVDLEADVVQARRRIAAGRGGPPAGHEHDLHRQAVLLADAQELAGQPGRREQLEPQGVAVEAEAAVDVGDAEDDFDDGADGHGWGLSGLVGASWGRVGEGGPFP